MPAAPSLTGIRVLVLEDDYYLATDTAEALEKAGATVVGPVSDPSRAAALAGSERLDCAVLDINLGEGPSFEAARAMYEHAIPFIFVTGYDDLDIPAEFGSATRLQKPLTESLLIRAVADVGIEKPAPAALNTSRPAVTPS